MVNVTSLEIQQASNLINNSFYAFAIQQWLNMNCLNSSGRGRYENDSILKLIHFLNKYIPTFFTTIDSSTDIDLIINTVYSDLSVEIFSYWIPDCYVNLLTNMFPVDSDLQIQLPYSNVYNLIKKTTTTPQPTTTSFITTTPQPTTTALITTTPQPTTTRKPTTTATPAPQITMSAPTNRPIPTDCSIYNVPPATLYNTLNDTDPYIYGFMLDCLQKKIIDINEPLNDLITTQETTKKDSITASEMNRGMRSIYQSDLIYTISKIFIFILLIGAYIYFLKGIDIVQPIKDGAKLVKDKLDKVKNVKMPNIRMPEVTMPSIKMPTK
jgi:hypothetical protein